jgi:hypothetical protein
MGSMYRRTDIQYDIDHVKWEFDNLSFPEWYESEGGGSQLCLQSYTDTIVQFGREDNPYTNGCGKMSRFPDRIEGGYHVTNPLFKNTVFEGIIKPYCRARFMTMVMHSTYSVHQDRAPRLHLALDTHPHAYFFWPEHKEFFHIPADGYLYEVDTTQPHTFVNAGPDRTHLVML